MNFSELEIHNFRSINEQGVKIQFDPSVNWYSFVGANNAGKSNILDALALVLGIRNGKFYNYKPGKTDFYNQDTSREMVIRLTLSTPLQYRNVYQQNCQVEGFVFQAKAYKTGESKGDINVAHYCFGVNAKGQHENPLTDSKRMYREKKGADAADIENARLPILAREQASKLGPAYFLDIQNLTTFFSISGLGPLGRLFSIYRDHFKTD
jgi:hypothetical protein